MVETALAHTLGSATESAYARFDLFDRRRELMETCATHCESGHSLPSAGAASPKAAPVGASATSTKQHLRKRVLVAFRAASGTADRSKQATATQKARRPPTGTHADPDCLVSGPTLLSWLGPQVPPIREEPRRFKCDANANQGWLERKYSIPNDEERPKSRGGRCGSMSWGGTGESLVCREGGSCVRRDMFKAGRGRE